MPEPLESRLSWPPGLSAALNLLLSALGAYGVSALYPTLSWTQHLSYLVGVALGGWVLAYALGRGIWWCSARRRGWWSLYAGLVLGIGWLIIWLAAQGQVRAQETTLAANLTVAEAQLQILRAERQAAALEAWQATRQEQATDRFARYVNEISVDELERLRALDARLFATLEAAADHYTTTLEQVEFSGPASWLRVATVDELEAARTAQTDMLAASRAFHEAVATFAERYTAALEAEDWSQRAEQIAQAERARLLQSASYESAQQIRAHEVAVVTVALQMLDLLRATWGEWQWDEAQRQVHFDDPAAEMEFARLSAQLAMLHRQRPQ